MLYKEKENEYLDVRFLIGALSIYVTLMVGYLIEFVTGGTVASFINIVVPLCIIGCFVTAGLFLIKYKAKIEFHICASIVYLIIAATLIMCGSIATTCFYMIPVYIFLSPYGNSGYILIYSILSSIISICHAISLNYRNLLSADTMAEFEVVLFVYLFVTVFSIGDSNKTKKDNDKLDEARLLAYKDNLTGVGTRAYLDEVLYKSKNIISRNSNVILCDLNDFKLINDTYGHDVGDLVLSQFGNILIHITSSYPRTKAFRIGGDEFIIITKKEFISDITNEIVMRIQLSEYLRNERFWLKVACGSSIHTIKEIGYEQALKEADENMYIEKAKMK